MIRTMLAAGACALAVTGSTTTIPGHLIIRDDGHDGYTSQLLVEDKNGAPMFWVNVFGAQSGGEPVCVTGLRLQPLACIGGPAGSYGGQASVTLYLNGRAVTVTAGELAGLVRFAQRHGWR
jgi:hypothetical protein